MIHEDLKCVIVLDETLPIGVAANVAAIMGVSLGKQLPDIVGTNVRDAEGGQHAGIVEIPIPVLKALSSDIRDIRNRAFSLDSVEMTIVGFTDIAQGCKDYGEYIARMGGMEDTGITYIGLLLVGKKKAVNKLVGSLPLLR